MTSGMRCYKGRLNLSWVYQCIIFAVNQIVSLSMPVALVAHGVAFAVAVVSLLLSAPSHMTECVTRS